MSTIVAIFRRVVRLPAMALSLVQAAPFVQVPASAPGSRIQLAKRKLDDLDHQDSLDSNVRKFICIGSGPKHLRYQSKHLKRAFDEVGTVDMRLESPLKRQKLDSDVEIPVELELALKEILEAHKPALEASFATWLATRSDPFPSSTSSAASSQGSIVKSPSLVSLSSSSSDGAASSSSFLANSGENSLANSSETYPTSDEDEKAEQVVNKQLEELGSEYSFSDDVEMLGYQEDEVAALTREVHEELEQDRLEFGVTIRTMNEDDLDLFADSGSEMAIDDDNSVASFDDDTVMSDGSSVGYVSGEEALDLFEDLSPIERDDFLDRVKRGDEYMIPAFLEEVKADRDANAASMEVDPAGYEADSEREDEREDERTDPPAAAAALEPLAFHFSSSAAAFGLSRR
ncbi:hypothetical protein JCM9279_004443 [Rhodotorula babjevae]